MDSLSNALYVVGAVFLLYAILWMVLFGSQRETVRERYEWIRVVPYHEWKTATEIAVMMQNLKGTHKKLWILAVYDLNDLRKEGLIESKQCDRQRSKVFRLTSVGRTWKDQKRPTDISFF